jgi:hypothetical protein
MTDLPGAIVPNDADHHPHLQPGPVNFNSAESQAAEAARLADRVNAERAALGLPPLESPGAPVVAGDLSPEAEEVAEPAPAVPVKPVAPVREPAPEPAKDGQFAYGLPRTPAVRPDHQ